jgi:hypothetical protein
MEAVPLFLTTLALTSGLAYLLGNSYRQEIMAQWKERRCELPIMIMAGQFKPPDDPRESSEFASDNFSFCARSLAAYLFKILITPLLILIGKNIDALNIVDQSTNLIRTLVSTLMNAFAKIMDPFYRRFLLVGRSFANGFAKMLSAMNRGFGIAVSAIFMGISATRATLNAIDFIIKVVMIILGILIGIFILLFFVLFPVTPVILSTLAVLSAVGIGVAGAGVFCFDAETEICLENGKTKPICKLKVGDRLIGNDVVEGILLTEREPNTTLFNYNGIVVSGSHIVWEEGAWKPVEETRYASPIQHATQRLYSLRTGSRTMTAHSKETGATVLFRDWEEILENDSITDAEWDKLVQELLSNSVIDTTASEEHPCFSGKCLVKKDGCEVPISTIRIGDTIQDINTLETRVLGVYTGLSFIDEHMVNRKWFTDGIWWKTTQWEHKPVLRTKLQMTQGVHLITESGTFWVRTEELSGGVRDFTEVGHKRLPETMDFLLKRLNEKPNH